MKKTLLIALLAATVGHVGAQQINGTFDDEWEACTPYQGAGSYYSTGVGKQPAGWNASSIYQMGVTKELVEQSEDAENTSVFMFNRYVGALGMGQVAPGYISLGTPWNAAKVKLFSGISEKDGGSFGGIEFGYKPDALRFSYKRGHGKANTPAADDSDGSENLNEAASVVALLWKGSYSSSVGVGVKLNSSPSKETMIDREKDVMGMITDGVTASDDAECIATINHKIEGEQSDWTSLVIPFTYTSDATPEKINVIFSSADYFGDRESIGAGNSLTIDDVVLLYYSQLSDLKYDGQTIAGFDKDTYAYDLSSVEYDATKSVEYTKTGVGSTVETSYDEATAVLTLTVKGNDYSADNQNQHVYTVQFKQPAVAALQAVKVCGVDLADFSAETTDYTLPYAYHQDVVIEATPADGTTVGEPVYNDDAKTITLTATNGDATRDYTFHFTETVANDQAGTYPGALSVVLTTGGVDQPTALANAPVELTFNADGTANLTLNNFKFFGGMILVGDIYVPGLPVVDGKISGTRTIRLTAFDENGKKDETAYGWMLGNLPVKVEASIIGDKQIAAGIDIITSETILASMFENIHVDLEPMEVSGELQDDGHYPGLTVTGRVTKKGASLLGIGSKPLSGEYPMQYIDLSGATIDSDVTREDIFTIAPSKNNTLVYAPAGSTLTGDNIIVGDQCAKLALTESAEFFAPKAFTAAEVSFDRDFTTDGVNTFVLPFGFDVPADMKVYELTGVEGEVLKYSNVDAVEANQPYLIETASARPFDALTNVEVAATEAADRTVNGVTHHGTFVAEDVESDETTYYELGESGDFVKAETATLLPFNTLISTTAASPATSYRVEIEPSTGIDSVVDADADKVIYDLSGRRVEKAVKGVYIINGKKVIVK